MELNMVTVADAVENWRASTAADFAAAEPSERAKAEAWLKLNSLVHASGAGPLRDAWIAYHSASEDARFARGAYDASQRMLARACGALAAVTPEWALSERFGDFSGDVTPSRES